MERSPGDLIIMTSTKSSELDISTKGYNNRGKFSFEQRVTTMKTLLMLICCWIVVSSSYSRYGIKPECKDTMAPDLCCIIPSYITTFNLSYWLRNEPVDCCSRDQNIDCGLKIFGCIDSCKMGVLPCVQCLENTLTECCCCVKNDLPVRIDC